MGMTYIHAALYLGSGVLSYQRRFPVVYFIRWAMRRPRTANRQLEVCALLCTYRFLGIRLSVKQGSDDEPGKLLINSLFDKIKEF